MGYKLSDFHPNEKSFLLVSSFNRGGILFRAQMMMMVVVM